MALATAVTATQEPGRCDPGRDLDGCQSQHAAHQVVRQGVEIVEAGDVPEFMLHDGQQVDPIYGPRIHGLQLPATAGRRKLFVQRRRGVDKPAVTCRIGIDVDAIRCRLRPLPIGARQIADDELDLAEFLDGGGVQTGGSPAGNGLMRQSAASRLA